MARTFDGGHVETVKDLPGPLQSGWNPGTWALPATMLSWASLVVLVAVFGIPQLFKTSRALYRLPVSAAALALVAAAIAWAVTLRCRNRPGRHLPRYWSLGLSILATTAGTVGFLYLDVGHSPWFHALALALITSSLALAPRLVKLHPDRWLVQHVATLGLAAVLFLALPLSYAFGVQAVESHKRRVAETIAELSRETGEVRQAYASAESRSRQETEEQVSRLQELPLELWVPDRYVWQGAAVLGEEARLAAAYRGLVEAVVAGLDPARTPPLWQPQFVWNHDGHTWEKDTVFPGLSTALARYHWRQGQLLRLLEPPPASGSGVLQELAGFYGEKKREADQHLTALSGTWDQDWVEPLVEAREPDSTTAASPLADLLRRPLIEESLRPVSLAALLNLRLREARRLADSIPGCGRREYDEDDVEYFRIDCYAYRANLNSKQPGADLRLEMRVVYKSDLLKRLGKDDLPVELYFLFPVPPKADPARYREEVMSTFAEAVAKEHGGVSLTKIDRSGSPGKGFFFDDRAGQRLRAVSSKVEDLSGGVPGIQIRAYYHDRSL